MNSWKRVTTGVYETIDGTYRVQRSYDGNLRINGWQLLASNGSNGWDWWNTYPTKSLAQQIVKEAVSNS